MVVRLFAQVAAFAALLAPFSSHATTVMELTFEDMAQRSMLVVHGTVQSSKAVQRDDGSIWTLTALNVNERFKGAAISKVTVKQPGGEVGALGQRVAGAATFSAGDEVVLFLEPAIDEKNVFVVMGLAAGKVNLETVHGQKAAIRHLDGLSFGKAGSRQVTRVERVEYLGEAAAFLARVKRASAPASIRGGQ